MPVPGPSATLANSQALPDTALPWVLRASPPSWRPYLKLARIDRPIGWQLLVLPRWWSSALAAVVAKTEPRLLHFVLFLIGAVAMRGAGSTFNDTVDQDIDRKVERTRNRPVASGAVSVRRAVLFLVAQSLVGAAVLFSLNRFSIMLGLASLIVVAAYPFAKRVTNWPQAVLGLAFAWGALMGWAAIFGALGWPAVLLYAAAILWTMGYDTIYALQDTTDDAVVGIGSTALFFGRHVRLGIALLYGGAVSALVGALATAHAGLASWLGAAAFGSHLAWQVVRIDRTDPRLALTLFRSNWNAGLLLLAGIVINAVADAAAAAG